MGRQCHRPPAVAICCASADDSSQAYAAAFASNARVTPPRLLIFISLCLPLMISRYFRRLAAAAVDADAATMLPFFFFLRGAAMPCLLLFVCRHYYPLRWRFSSFA